MSEAIERLQDEYGRLLIRRVLLKDDWASDVIFDVAAGNKTEWTPEEWDSLIAELEQSNERVNDWLARRVS